MGAVIDESVRSGSMMPAKDFALAKKSIYTKSWIPSPWTVISWMTGIASHESYDVDGRLRLGDLVMLPVIEKIADKVLATQIEKSQSLTDRIMSREDFSGAIRRAAGQQLSQIDIGLLLKFLSRDRQALSYDDQIIKFKAPQQLMPSPITQQDVTVASLKTLISSLTYQCDKLAARITSLTQMAQSSVKAGNKVSALSALKSRKLAEKAFQQRSTTLHQLEEVYAKVEQAADQVDIVRVMEASTGVLKDLNKQTGGVERVEDVIEQLREEMVSVDEIGDALREEINPNVAVDETEIEEELEVLEKEEKVIREAEEAEATAKRLNEIAKPTSDVNEIDTVLSESAERLQRLRIEQDRPLETN